VEGVEGMGVIFLISEDDSFKVVGFHARGVREEFRLNDFLCILEVALLD
jgi:hypothetical protein